MGIKKLSFTFLIVFAFCNSITPKKVDNKIWKVYFYRGAAKKAVLNCEVAISNPVKAKGLMFRKKLAENSGMIFVYQKDRSLTFWMKNTYIPLSIAFVNSKNLVVDIQNMKPHDLTVIRSKQYGRYAIEANPGWFMRHDIKEGDTIKIVN